MITYQKKLQYISEQRDNPSYRQLAKLLKTNHVTIQKLLKGVVQLPSINLRRKIDELFYNYSIVMEIRDSQCNSTFFLVGINKNNGKYATALGFGSNVDYSSLKGANKNEVRMIMDWIENERNV